MWDALYAHLCALDQIFWGYVAFALIMVLGTYFTVKMRFLQLRALPSIFKIFIQFLSTKPSGEKGVHPLKTFFASVGGMIGIGNVVVIVSAVQIGGPGALFWVWVAAIVGALIKYAEIILGFKYRVPNQKGGYDGGPIYFLRAAFKTPVVSLLVAVLLCIYGIEIYQFKVITDTVVMNWHFDRYLVMGGLLVLIIYAGIGGINRIGKICSMIMPFFLFAYLFMGIWLIIQNAQLLPGILHTVFTSAFQGHAALGGFAGSTALIAIQQGISRACYSADLGIGYDSMIQSESSTVYPQKQASLAILGVFLDNLICTLSIFIVLVSGVWKASPVIEASELIKHALTLHFPVMKFFMPLFLLIVGYTTIIAYFCVGMKCARFLFPKRGEKLYILFAVVSFIFYSFFDQTQALLVMSLSGALLISFNLLGIYRLRHEIVPVVEGSQQVNL
jgi:AGCS family alanine or glycine:cation symporter